MLKRWSIVLALLLAGQITFAQQAQLSSPNGQIQVSVSNADTITMSLRLKQKIFFTLKAALYAQELNLKIQQFKVRRYFSQRFNAMTIDLNPEVSLDIRLYDNGFAYRWITSKPDSIIVQNELMNIYFPEDYLLFFPKEKSLISHYERLYKKLRFSQLKDSDFASLPVLIKSEQAVVLVSDADLYDYPNMFLQKQKDHLAALFPKYVLETKPASVRRDRNEKIVKQADYIARTWGKRSFPWRVFMIGFQDKDLLNNQLVMELSRCNPDGWDFSWVKPGKVAWDWWNARQLEGVDFKPGINTQTYKYYIDFAARFGLQYVILDEGWSATTWDLLHFKPEIDVKELIQYGQQKGIGLILWVLWKPLDLNMEQVLDSFALWGVKGIKVDFMQRADQKMVQFYERTARQAAMRHLIVDFHGAYKPSGLRRAYPNVLSYEGVKGAEHNKWSFAITPEHNVTLPFIRNVVGPMDYTPGGMRNVTKKKFKISWKHPRVMSTRAHQVAMYVVYYSPLQMLADSPTEYEKDTITTRFIARIPTVWDQTVPLDGEVGKFVALARRYGMNWYIGVMNGNEPRTLNIKLDFLPKGKKYKIEIYQDVKESAQDPTKYQITTQTVDHNSSLTVQMPFGGGMAAILTPVK